MVSVQLLPISEDFEGSPVLYAGSTLNITCSIDISPNVDTNFTIEVEWTRNGVPPPGPPRVTTTPATETTPNHYQTQLTYNTLSSSEDSGEYVCSITVDSMNSLVFVEDSEQVSEHTSLIVQSESVQYNNV